MSFDYDAFAVALGRSLKNALADAFINKALGVTKNYVAAPDVFDGTRAHYETFRRSIELYVKAIPTDTNKILSALSFLTQGDADAWAQNWVQAHDIDKTPVTWDRFLKDLDEKFLDPRIAENTRESLAKLTQGRDPADTFFLKFDELRTKSGFVIPEHHDIVLVDDLRRNMRASTVLAVMSSYESKRALTDGVTDAYHEAGVINQAACDKLVAARRSGISYKEFRAFALNQDPIIRRHGEASPTHHLLPPPPCRENGQFFHKVLGVHYESNGMFARPIGVAPRPPPVLGFPMAPAAPAALAAPAAPAARDLDAMDVDRARARALGLCHRCKKPGHVARDCQEKCHGRAPHTHQGRR
ncbi:hypothetical protein AURDEDRAFT_178652 [Auricularia subglabra TFB-10046 SS5]|uniref:CCHC-type domain-containing protein n=1 Tax=Auricularia subglabra (strain TFB-10046 / SS5) TaxID=717982 RepID=J0D150_AURST|nr:hypothetical protein AURDEDRAFT_178652 [Auricularia subglabra TFB-10046 SS5]